MSKRILIKCDGPNPTCEREIDSTIHVGTWLTLKEGNIFDKPSEISPVHFCSYYCLEKYIHVKFGIAVVHTQDPGYIPPPSSPI